jgi:sigma-54 dependent transcriptional regulator, acetoin dehydrogenase operon transcriptional activator AcoR
MEPAKWTQILARARARLIAGDEIEPGIKPGEGPSKDILASWRRSYHDGANHQELQTPFEENINLASRLVRAAEPVIGRVHEDVLGSPITVVLADSKGKVLIRRSGEHDLELRLDRSFLAPGFNYAERYVGTNGIGTALEGKAPMLVTGAEHFNEDLQTFACVGVPVRDPVTRRQLGVLDLTTWHDRVNPALTALARQAATVIEEGLLELSSRGSKALLDAYLVASRNREDSVLAIGEDAFIGNAYAVRRLGNITREELWPLILDALANRDEAELPLLTSTGAQVRIRLSAVRVIRLVGAIVEIRQEANILNEPQLPTVPANPDPEEIGREEIGSFSKLSPISMGPAIMIGRLAANRMPVCLVGEPGVGKRVLVESVAARHFDGQPLRVFSAESMSIDELLAAVTDSLQLGRPVIVRGVDALGEGHVTQVVGCWQPGSQPESAWLVLSLQTPSPTNPGGRVQVEVATLAIPMVSVPPLRSRIQDLHQIVPAMLTQLSGGSVTAVTPALMSRLVREPWPGNLAEVSSLLQKMLARGAKGKLDVSDLPAGFGAGVRRQLTPLEWMEREAIIDALRACGGDKSKAAQSLGLSRASIYRKIKAFDINPDQP